MFPLNKGVFSFEELEERWDWVRLKVIGWDNFICLSKALANFIKCSGGDLFVLDLARDRSGPRACTRRFLARLVVRRVGCSLPMWYWVQLCHWRSPSLHGSWCSCLWLSVSQISAFIGSVFFFSGSGFLVLVESWNRRRGAPGWILTVFAPPMHTCTVN